MTVAANVAYSLADETGFGPELCKMALERANHDKSSALEVLSRWVKPASNKAENIALHGVMCSYFDSDYNAAAIGKIVCSDELLAISPSFKNLASEMMAEVVAYNEPFVSQPDIDKLQLLHNCKIVNDFVRFEKTDEFSLLTTFSYENKICSIVETIVDNKNAFQSLDFRKFSFDCAMHIVAFAPLSVSIKEFPQNKIEKARLKIEKELLSEGKEMKYWAVATEGKLNKWLEQQVLLNQIFIKSDTEKVETIRAKISDQIGSNIEIKRFARLSI